MTATPRGIWCLGGFLGADRSPRLPPGCCGRALPSQAAAMAPLGCACRGAPRGPWGRRCPFPAAAAPRGLAPCRQELGTPGRRPHSLPGGFSVSTGHHKSGPRPAHYTCPIVLQVKSEARGGAPPGAGAGDSTPGLGQGLGSGWAGGLDGGPPCCPLCRRLEDPALAPQPRPHRKPAPQGASALPRCLTHPLRPRAGAALPGPPGTAAPRTPRTPWRPRRPSRDLSPRAPRPALAARDVSVDVWVRVLSPPRPPGTDQGFPARPVDCGSSQPSRPRRLSAQEIDFLALPLSASPSRGSSSCSEQNSLRPHCASSPTSLLHGVNCNL